MDRKTLDELASIHAKGRILNWWKHEPPFQIVVEAIAAQQCKLTDALVWVYELKVLADEATEGNMANEVMVELEEWLRKNGSTWKKEAEDARTKLGWRQSRIRYVEGSPDKNASVAVRSLWAWYGKNFPGREGPQFLAVKEWSNQHKQWLLTNRLNEIIYKMTFKMIASTRKLQGIREFIRREREGEFRGLAIGNAVQKLGSIVSVGDETARKIALFYFDIPVIIFDPSLLRISLRHNWISSQSEKWNAESIRSIEEPIRFWLRNFDVATQSERLKSIYAVIDYCASLYCKREDYGCYDCPLSSLLPLKAFRPTKTCCEAEKNQENYDGA